MNQRPLIAHVVYRFDVGGMENGLVNLINRLPDEFADHCVIALTEAAPDFCARLRRRDVRVIALKKPPGPTLLFLPRLWRTFRSLGPDIVHTRNAGTLETQLAAWMAGVATRIHGEHGWDVDDLAGENRRLLRMRRRFRRLVGHHIALSEPIHRYLVEKVGVPEGKVTNICNGVDTAKFTPAEDAASARASIASRSHEATRIFGPGTFAVGAIGRLAKVKNLGLLLDAFDAVAKRNSAFRADARLVLVGDGPDREFLDERVAQLGIAAATWMTGSRSDVADFLRALDLLVVPSLAEGISNAILEAMSCGLPIAATDVGGNRELIEDGVSGTLIPSGDVGALARTIETYFTDRRWAADHGRRARERAVTHFSLDTMIAKYHRVYCGGLSRGGWPAARLRDGFQPAAKP